MLNWQQDLIDGDEIIYLRGVAFFVFQVKGLRLTGDEYPTTHNRMFMCITESRHQHLHKVYLLTHKQPRFPLRVCVCVTSPLSSPTPHMLSKVTVTLIRRHKYVTAQSHTVKLQIKANCLTRKHSVRCRSVQTFRGYEKKIL